MSKFIPSPHFMSRREHDIKAIVIHRMAGTFQGTIAWFQNPESKVSAHYLVSQEGEIVQMVRDREAAWHAGYKSGSPPEPFRDVANPNWVSIGIECEDRTSQDVDFWTQKQLNALVDLCKILVEEYEIPIDREHIVGHCEIDPVRKPNCPGSHFPWDEFMNYLKEETKPTPPPADQSEKITELENVNLKLREEKRLLEQELRGKIDSLEKSSIQLEKERNEARAEVESLKATLGKKEVEVLDLQGKVSKLREEMAKLTSQHNNLVGLANALQKSEKSLRGLLEKLEKENAKEVSELTFDTSKPYVRWIQIFLWNGLSAVIPAVATFLTADIRYLVFAPLVNATAKTLLDIVKRKSQLQVAESA